MNCADVRRRLGALHDGELRPEQALEVERHLETCAECRAERARIEALATSLRAAAAGEAAPVALRERVRDAVRAQAAGLERGTS